MSNHFSLGVCLDTRAAEWHFKRLDMTPECGKLLTCEATMDYRTPFFKSDWEEDCRGVWTFLAKYKE
ncbi:hypothetical protein SBP02_18485 [Pseudomonas benzenivorans]|uniref:Uncharacterized protein n=1 Tax=Pseudomonas benzenivorans TaxID=556533 RepID=A0ABZ0PUZ3_9PSED|nr:hypothetical protein [Pseudomonas benzenivorans]WPC04720.1 hypothetical protein SBP02_18485 [Pseudomonas benzenivorans]